MPDWVWAALVERGLVERCRARPPYQQNDYLSWITRAVREETKQRRLAQMLDELERGDAYMGMAYQPRDRQ
ncbi:MAG: YdeI/OmpD-associated family protein [Chloroflexi bacterium]|nr:YdeI/OmpD-associated family protein [Chloroflexota bacterium]